MSHSILPPSSAHIWGAPGGCTGWPTMINSVPEEYRNVRSAESMEGDAAHALAARIISFETAVKRDDIVGTVILGVVVTDVMYDACEMYVGDVMETLQKIHMSQTSVEVEKRIPIYWIHKDCFGTPDSFLYDVMAKTIYVWDFKYGHMYIDEFENWQVLTYAAGIVSSLVINQYDTPDLRIVFRIVQPRAYGEGGPVREWSISVSNLFNYIGVLKKNAEIALSSAAVNHTGPHCRYCGARHTCPDALTAGLSLYESTSAPTVQNLSLEALGTQYLIIERAKEQIDCLESGFKEQIKHLLKSGKNVPGYMLAPLIGRERWNRPDSDIITMGEMLGQNLSNGKAITPNQARKKNIDESVISMFSERLNNGTKLTKSDTKLASKIFLTEGSI